MARSDHQKKNEETKLSMTSMIDIVFLLLVFFVMTFKIVEHEGDFRVRMPAAGPNPVQVADVSIPLKLRMEANQAGELQRIRLNELDMGTDFQKLQREIIRIVGDDSGPPADGTDQTVEIEADFNLKYEHVIDAITSVSGKRKGQQTLPLIRKIKFAPQ